ncbi:hypothetical protein H112_06707 [Trichophyton rubrum D6]|uniref:Something about silencing protein 4 domain-containing protein n=3 Tax=Trichophyton TaxID=5550 RepID=F2SJ71_TRIRC|nr:uncharacterized protein TERG_02055 [Trichophyton rubrum CBS 118892]EZF12397.1 hypothetical protein H100_06723 [Trichophyton rubrum MR850]EZF39367.1 hypothetical protein H102_06690 [Trichophyton rubrum CBS 100081]EZF49821.1 hypothetical protein H103_06714 [Trichophyton rubrum CBS 288.86]EZF60395.1 hypothetical protein H104_06669 [Trichophyton rubrum CBS 289.86]EZF71103.1 hypothetical protein H105_06727 [Trichophyton soudanense CBS 452.61]EZF92488.1 hypothetical protein H113_06760 [Trichophy
MMTRTVTSPPSCSTRTRTQRQHHQQHQQQHDQAPPGFAEPPPPTSASPVLPPHQEHTHANTHQVIYAHDEPPPKRTKLHHSPPQVSGQLPLRARDAQGQSSVVARPHSLPQRHIQTQLVTIRSPRNGDDSPGTSAGGCLSFAKPDATTNSATRTSDSTLVRPTRASLRHPRSIQVDEGDMPLVQRAPGGGEDVDMQGVEATTKNEVHLKTPQGPTATTPAGGEKRSLRSHDGGTRPSKSELAMYFPNYEQILSLEPAKQEFLCAETTVTLVDDLAEPVTLDHEELKSSSLPQNPLENLHNAEVVDVGSFEGADGKDLLDEDTFFKAHRRLERQEKQLRNLEKERAQYEKTQLDHLLGELQGHDWLRVMGINGVTDSEKKLYEPKRDYFVGEVTALLEKFRAWKEEEKRRRIEREQALQAEEDEQSDSQEENENEDEDEAEEEEEEEDDDDEEQNEGEDEDESGIVEGSSERTSTTAIGSLPDPDDVDRLAAHQLYQEVISATKNKKLKIRKSNQTSQPVKQSKTQPQQQPTGNKGLDSSKPVATYIEPNPWPTGPFLSFFSKPHLREAALKKHKRGRTRMAFGKPLPEIEEASFRLPDEILTPEAIRAAQRRNRRMRREDGKPGNR